MASDQPTNRAASAHAWRRPAATTSAGRPAPVSRARQQRKKLYRVTALLLALGGAILGMLFWVRSYREPYFLSLVITEYGSRMLPVNAFAKLDGEGLSAIFPPDHTVSAAHTSQNADELLQEIDKLFARAKDHPVVLHLAALAHSAASDSSGEKKEVILYLASARPEDAGAGLPLRKVLDRFAKDHPDQPKLLLLDIHRPVADPAVGVTTDTVSEVLDRQLHDVDYPNLFVLCPCSPGETAQACEIYQHSLFGYSVLLGLRGLADGYGTGRLNGEVTVQTLARYVTDRVSYASEHLLGQRQTPLLYGTGDFTLLRRPVGQSVVVEEIPEETPTYPPFLAEGWKQRDAWWTERVYRLAPLAYRKLGALLAHAEAQWRGGREPGRIESEIGEPLRRLKKQASESAKALPRRETPSSLIAWRVETGTKADPALLDSIRAFLAKSRPDSKPGSLDKEVMEFLKALPATVTGPELAAAVVEVLVDDREFRVDRVRLAQQVLDQKQLTSDFLETLYLAPVADMMQKTGGRRAATLGQDLLQIVRLTEELGTIDLLSWPAIRGLLDGAQEQSLGPLLQERIKTEQLFFQSDAPAAEVQARMEKLKDRLTRVRDYVQKLQEAQALYEQSLVAIAEVLPPLIHARETGTPAERLWSQAVEQARSLEALLLQARQSPPAEAELDAAKDTLAVAAESLSRLLHGQSVPDHREGLLDRFQTPAGRLAKEFPEEKQEPVRGREMNILLYSAAMSAKDRQDLWLAHWSLTHQLAEQAHNTIASNQPLAPLTTYERDRSLTQEDRHRRQRQELTIQLLSSAGFNEQAGSTAPPSAPRKLNTLQTDEDWTRFWSKDVVERVSATATTAAELWAADRWNRLLPPFLLEDQGRNGAGVDDAAVRLRLLEAPSFWKCLAKHYAEQSRIHAAREGLKQRYLNLVLGCTELAR